MNLNKLFNPRSIAIIGASNKPGSVGKALFDNAVGSKQKRDVYPVNIKGSKIGGQDSFVSVKDIGKAIDLVVIATPAFTVPAVLEECAEAKAKNVVVISAGFNESGREGEKLFEKCRRIAKQNKIRVLGPNCLGFIMPDIDLNMSFASKQALPGSVALVSQSGAMCTALLDWSLERKIGFSSFVSLGSAMDIGFSDMIEHLAKDNSTRSIVLYMESLNDSERFLRVCKKVTKKKPIFVLKSGRSSEGANAAKSHTGSLAGNDKAFDALFRQAGVVRLNTIQDIYNSIIFSSANPNKLKSKLTIVTNAGGPGVISTDYLSALGGELAHLSMETKRALDKKLPASWSKGNPIDIIGDATPERFGDTIRICLKDKKIDNLMVVISPQTMTEPLKIAQAISRLRLPRAKSIFVSFIGGEEVEPARAYLRKKNIAVFDTPERAISSYMSMIDTVGRQKSDLKYQNLEPKIRKSKAENIIKTVREDGRQAFSEDEAKSLLDAYQIPVMNYAVATSPKEAEANCKKLVFPIVMKVLSSDILHKIDSGGVELGVERADVVKIYNKIIKNSQKYHPRAKIKGVFMESMHSSQLELIIGVSQDPVLGPVIMFGRGGSEVELYNDVSFSVLPLTMFDISEMIQSTKVEKRIRGFRGLPGGDIDTIASIIYRISLLVRDFPEIKELDINPLSVDGKNIKVLDAKVVLDS